MKLMQDDFLRENVRYDPVSGNLYWKLGGQGRSVHKPIGTIEPNGYRRITVNFVKYMAHRVCWFLYHEQWPEGVIDHVNGNRLDNSLCNLRDTTPYDNSINKTNNITDIGIYNTPAGKFLVKKQMQYLGTFDSIEEARFVYHNTPVMS